MHDLARLVDDLDLFLVVPVGLWPPAAGDDVVGELPRIDAGLRLGAGGDRLRLLVELVDQGLAGARRGLIGRDQDAFNTHLLVQRAEDDGKRDGAAVGIGDDALVARDVVPVDLGHDQGHVLLHPPGRAVVDHYRAGLDRDRRVHERDVAAGREERDVDALERVFVQRLDGEPAAVVCHRHALGPFRGERDHPLRREAALGQDLEHLLPDDPRRPDDGNV